jgi:hypothetical protein
MIMIMTLGAAPGSLGRTEPGPPGAAACAGHRDRDRDRLRLDALRRRTIFGPSQVTVSSRLGIGRGEHEDSDRRKPSSESRSRGTPGRPSHWHVTPRARRPGRARPSRMFGLPVPGQCAVTWTVTLSVACTQ